MRYHAYVIGKKTLGNCPATISQTSVLDVVQISFAGRLTIGKLMVETNKYQTTIDMLRGLVMASIARDHARAMSAHAVDNLCF